MNHGEGGEVTNSFLRVEKRIEYSKHGETAVAVAVHSESDLTLAFRVVDRLPEGTTRADVCFHRDSKPDRWAALDRERLVFSDTVAPDETVATFYYLDTDGESPPAFTEPTIQDTVPVAPEKAADDGPLEWREGATELGASGTVSAGPVPDLFAEAGSSQPTSEQSADDAGDEDDQRDDRETAADDEARTEPRTGDQADGAIEQGTEEDAEPTELFAELQAEFEQEEYDEFRADVEEIYPDEVGFKELLIGDADTELPAIGDPQADSPSPTTNGGHGGNEPEAGEPPATAEQSGDEQSAGAGSVLDRLLDELATRELSEDERTRLREMLGVTATHQNTVKLRHLQTKVADLAAYIDAFERLFEDEASAIQVIEGLRDDIDAIQARVDDLADEGADRADRQSALEQRVETVETEFADHAELAETVTELRAETSAHRRELDQIRTRFDRVTDETNSALDAMAETIGEQRRDLDAVEAEVDSLQANHERIVNAFGAASSTFPDPENDEPTP